MDLMNKPLAMLSFSGGMDTASLLLHLLNRGYAVHAVTFNYQQRHQFEIACSKSIIAYLQEHHYPVEHHMIDLTSAMADFHSALTKPDIAVPLGHYHEASMKVTVVPNRNAIFASIIYGKALSLAESSGKEIKLSLGVHSGDQAIYPDCRPEFYQAIHHAFTIGNWNSEQVSFYLPYIEQNKTAILRDALASCEQMQIDFNYYFSLTNTCYQPDQQNRSCGQCGSCHARLEAFAELGIKDPVRYA